MHLKAAVLAAEKQKHYGKTANGSIQIIPPCNYCSTSTYSMIKNGAAM